MSATPTLTVPSTSTVASTTTTPPSVDVVKRACTNLLDAVSMLDLDDPEWARVGPLVLDAATSLREAVGVATVPGSPHAAPIVHQRDLSTAARRLLATDVRIVDHSAARAFVRLAWSLHVECR